MPRPAVALRPVRATATLVVATVVLAGCGRAPTAFGASPATARMAADGFFQGLAVRFHNVHRAPKFAAARGKLGKHALSPSRLIGDTSVWTSGSAAAGRVLELEGAPTATGYAFLAHAAPAPVRPGESRHVIRLQQLGDGEYQWNTAVEHAVGRVRAADFAEVLTAGLAALERPERDVRAELRATLPRASAAFGRLFTLETVRATRLADGSSVVDVGVRFDPDRIRPAMPALAEYVDKYVEPARAVVALTDGRGGTWLELRGREGTFRLRWRTHDGRLLALDGAPRPMPDTLRMVVDASAKFLMFRVGVSRMVGDVAVVRGAHERGWVVRFRHAPKWHFPLAVNHLISKTLDRPFADGGMHFRLTLRDSDVSQTLIARRFDVAVQESAIVRWLGGLGGKAMDDFAGRVEVEENRFLAEGFGALRADVAAALASPVLGH